MSAWKQELHQLWKKQLCDSFSLHLANRAERFLQAGKTLDDILYLLIVITAQMSFVSKNICIYPQRLHALSDGFPHLKGREEDRALPEATEMDRVLQESPEIVCCLTGGGVTAGNKLLIYEDGRLYLNRYYMMEMILTRQLLSRCQPALRDQKCQETLPEPQEILSGITLDESQITAIQETLNSHFQVITGGPGTGKTTILCAILTLCLLRDPSLRIYACAPTGKAQARMQEAIVSEFNDHIDPGIRSCLLTSLPHASHCLPISYSTVHRLLHLNPITMKGRYDEGTPLAADIVVVDEVSMLDISLITKLLSSLSIHTKVILLGDSDQLSAVESGAVLYDICSAWEQIEDPKMISRLTNTHRFKAGSNISILKDLINGQQVHKVRTVLQQVKDAEDPALSYRSDVTIEQLLKQSLVLELSNCKEFVKYQDAPDVETMFSCFEKFRILCAVRQGPFGVETVNRVMMQILDIQEYENGYPVMIRTNDYDTGLFNGDIGICRKDHDGPLRIYFPGEDGFYRSFSLAQLPEHEPVFAMTIHKSQGSGFDHVLLILPLEGSPVLTKELLYTGLTRAKKHCTIWGTEQMVSFCVSRRMERTSGLSERLKNGVPQAPCPDSEED